MVLGVGKGVRLERCPQFRVSYIAREVCIFRIYRTPHHVNEVADINWMTLEVERVSKHDHQRFSVCCG